MKNRAWPVFLDIYKNRRKCDYTVEYSDKAKASHENTGKILSSEEHSKMSEIDFKDCFSSRENLITWYFSYLSNIDKIDIIPEIGRRIKTGEIKKILSIGAGPSAIEYAIKKVFGRKIDITVTDYDKFIMENVKRLFPELNTAEFDFTKDDVTQMIEEYSPDTVMMIGSGCSMNDREFYSFLKEINGTGVERIYCFEAAVITKMVIAKICIKKGLDFLSKHSYDFNHSFHAYYRTKGETVRIYKKAGWKIKEIHHLVSYPVAFELIRQNEAIL